jgi:mannose-1-phosphate guanylyltransferase/mannose-6-phosphate isomerase
MAKATLIPVILCGGSGTRLWPASRESHPKQFLSLINDLSLLQNTIRRGLNAEGANGKDIVIVTLAAMQDLVIEQMSDVANDATAHILCEPSARNTAAAVALAADYVAATFGPDVVMWVLPADHHIGDESVLSDAVAKSLDAVAAGHLVTFGINPTRPDTGYGYILRGDAIDASLSTVSRFVEKPDLTTAKSYLESGEYLWNSGMFLFTAGAVLKQFEQHASDVLGALRASTAENAKSPAADLYAAIPSIPFDKAIMEKSDKVAVAPCNPMWSDIGSWESLWELRGKDHENNVIDGRATCINAKGCLVQSQDRLIAIAGLDNIVVIETEDAVMIGQKSDGDSMKALVNSLKKSGAREVVDAPLAKRTQAWTMVKNVQSGDGALHAHEITLSAGETQDIEARDGGLNLFTVLQGSACLVVDGTERMIGALESVNLPASQSIAIRNVGKGDLVMIGVYKGDAEGVFFGAANDSLKVA